MGLSQDDKVYLVRIVYRIGPIGGTIDKGRTFAEASTGKTIDVKALLHQRSNPSVGDVLQELDCARTPK